jgi:hypothetical protein
MNLYIKKISTLAGVGVISILSTFQTFTNVDAAITKPVDYDIGFESISSAFYYSSSNGSSPTSIALFTRTIDSPYFNYTHNFSSGQHSNTSNYDLPDGLDITMIFNRSNTSWTDASSAGFTGYYASDTKIGSDNLVGASSKLNLEFDNQTSNDYFLYLDISTTGSFQDRIFELHYNNLRISDGYFNYVLLHTADNTTFMKFHLSSFSTLLIKSPDFETSQLYFDAWYLQDLGTSASYQEGYDLGEAEGYADGLGNNPNVLLNGFQAMVGILVNFMLMILNLEVFNISLMSLFSVIALFIGFIWVLKIVRG